MCRKLPIKEFKWRHKALTLSQIQSWDPEGDVGYFVECDVTIPTSLHEHFNDLPPFPESLLIDDSMVSTATKLARERRGLLSTKPAWKLTPNLFPKKKYKCHISVLQYYLSLGCVLDNVHRVLQFKQSDWLSPYINFNTSQRQQATSEFDKSFFKLMNNRLETGIRYGWVV